MFLLFLMCLLTTQNVKDNNTLTEKHLTFQKMDAPDQVCKFFTTKLEPQ